MKFVKNALSIAMCSLFTLPAFAADKDAELVDFYGKVNISVQATDEGDFKEKELKSNASRVGVKGKYELAHGLTAIYKLEFEVNIDGDSSETLKARNQWVGVQGDFGELTVGRSDTTFKVAQGKFDLFNDYEGDIKHLFVGENRLSDTISYKSPVYSNVQFLATYILTEDSDSDDSLSVALTYGDLNLKKTDYFLSVAYDNKMAVNKGSSSGIKGVQLNNTRITGMYNFGKLRLGGMLVDTELERSGKSENGYAVNVAYKFDKVQAKAQFQEFAGSNAVSLGADYKLGKSTKVYAWYTDREGLSYVDSDMTVNSIATEGDYFAIGMEQKF
ncbi:porin [Thalassotalea sp. PLHSN55]|uniref:porin n=1 Tax=Thalassotalea sp. PLHSN55 TaxID=3435888 RepID=UPI003F85C492